MVGQVALWSLDILQPCLIFLPVGPLLLLSTLSIRVFSGFYLFHMLRTFTVRVDTSGSSVCSLFSDYLIWHVFLCCRIWVGPVIPFFNPSQHLLFRVRVPNRVPTVLAISVFIGVSVNKPTSQPCCLLSDSGAVDDCATIFSNALTWVVTFCRNAFNSFIFTNEFWL